ERRDQERLANAAAALIFGDACRSKESFARALASSEANHATRSRRDVDRYRLVREADRYFISPGDRKTLFDEFTDRRDLKRLRPAYVDALLAQFINQRFKRRQLQKTDQQIGHGFSLAEKCQSEPPAVAGGL